MTKDSGQSASPNSTIHTILESYPFSNNFLHDILRNSDDARATKQVFVLDRRHHGTKDLYHPYFTRTQGPAFLAHNDATTQMDDWEELKSAHQPSKVADTTKACDYGIGLLSCYHVTDTPHILSGLHLAILDPKHEFVGVSGVQGGVRLDLEHDSWKYDDHLAAFSSFFSRSDWGKPFHGTILRLPLRTSASQISNNVTSSDDISNFLRSFAAEELNISLLFLRSVSSIDIYEISANGKKTQIASATINRTPPEPYGKYEIHKATIQTNIARSLEKGEWRILHAPFSKAGAVGTLSKRLGSNPTATLYKYKLSPTIDLAIPLDSPPSTKIGRLFTHLPLPLRTGFPVHINALFGLTQSRQNLRNTAAVGTIKDLGDCTLIEWNRLLFDTYIPLAWAVLVKVLVTHDNFESILDVWPSPQDEVDSEDYVYWKDMSFHVARYAPSLTASLVTSANPPYKPAAATLITGERPEAGILAAPARACLLLTQVTQAGHLVDDILSPETAYNRLKPLADKMQTLDATDAQAILSYLLSTSNCHNIVGLPLIPSVSGARIALATSTFSRKSHVLLNEIEEDLFAIYDPYAVSLRQLEPDVREALVNHGPGVLNVTKLNLARVSSYLNASSYASQSQQVATGDQIHWLNRFWDWVQAWFSDLHFLNGFNLVPTTKGFQCPTETVFDPENDHEIIRLLELLTVPVIDPRLNTRARGALKQLQPSSNIHALLRALPTTISVKFSEREASYLCAYLIKNLPSACARHGSISTDKLLRSRLRALPIFPIISVSSDGATSTHRTSIASAVIVRGVDRGQVQTLPPPKSVVYLDLRVIHQDMLRYLNLDRPPQPSTSDVQDMVLENFQDRSPKAEIAFIKYLSSDPPTISCRTQILSPETTYRRLKPFAEKIEAFDSTDTQAILRYLLSRLNFCNIMGLPLVPSVSGARLALTASTGFSKAHVLLNEIEEDLFAIYDPNAVSLRQLEPDVRKVLVDHGPGVLNVTRLNIVRVFVYLCASPYGSQSQHVATSDQIHWLNKFWDWVQTWSSDLRFLDEFHLVPTTKGFRRPTETVFDPQVDQKITSLLELLTVPVIDPRLNTRARGALKQLQPSSNIHALLCALQMPISVVFHESEANYLCTYLIKNLPSACARHGPISINNPPRPWLRALPIFPVISASSDGGTSTRRMSIASTATVRGVDPGQVPILPPLESVVYLDLRAINEDILRYLDSKHPFPLTISELQDMVLENFQDRSPEAEVAFIKYLSSHPLTISRGTQILSPETAYRRLKPFADKIDALDALDARVILRYLLSTLNLRNIVGLPLVPSVSGARLALTASPGFGKAHVLLNEIEQDLFAIYDPNAVSLRQLEPDARKALVDHGPGVLNVTRLNIVRVFVYLCASPYASQSQHVATNDQIHWLNKFWDWAQNQFLGLRFFNRFNLVPTTNGLRRPSEIVFDPQADHQVASPFGVPVIDPRLNARAREALKRLWGWGGGQRVHTPIRHPPPTNLRLSTPPSNIRSIPSTMRP